MTATHPRRSGAQVLIDQLRINLVGGEIDADQIANAAMLSLELAAPLGA